MLTKCQVILRGVSTHRSFLVEEASGSIFSLAVFIPNRLGYIHLGCVVLGPMPRRSSRSKACGERHKLQQMLPECSLNAAKCSLNAVEHCLLCRQPQGAVDDFYMLAMEVRSPSVQNECVFSNYACQ